MTACTWIATCTDQARHLVWRRGGWGQVETEATCGRHRGDAVVAGYRHGVPGTDTERFELRGDLLRQLTDWVEATDLVAIEVPPEVASVVHEMRSEPVDRRA